MKIAMWFMVLFCISSCVAFAQTVDPGFVAIPGWVTLLLKALGGLPVVGQVFMWFGVILNIVTIITHSARAIIAVLSSVAGFFGLDKAGAALDAFDNSKTMYLLKYGAALTKPATPAPTPPSP